MSSAEFRDWQAFELIEGPLTDRRTEAMLAVVGAAVVNALGTAKKQVRPDDLMPKWDRAPRRPPSVARIEAQLRALTERFKEV